MAQPSSEIVWIQLWIINVLRLLGNSHWRRDQPSQAPLVVVSELLHIIVIIKAGIVKKTFGWIESIRKKVLCGCSTTRLRLPIKGFWGSV